MKRLVAVLAGSLMAAALWFPPSASGGPGRRDLARLSVFEGNRSASTVMRLPRPVEVSTAPFRNELTSFRSTGRVAGLVLKQDVPKDGVEVLALSLAMCDRPPCDEKRLSVTHVWKPAARGFPKKTTLPAGDYFVYLIADGPTEADLHLPGLEGEVHASLSPADDVDIVEPDTSFDPLPQHTVYSAEAEQELDGTGWAMMAIDMETDSEVFGDVQTCLQDTPRRPGVDDVSVPLLLESCDGSGSGTTFVSKVPGSHRHVILSLATIGKGTYFHSLSYKMVSDVKSMSALAVDLSVPRGKRSGGFSSGTWWDD
jgi:hypothetical protein